MEIGIAYPKIIPATRGERIMEWAMRVDEGPFSSLALIDRLVYDTHESMVVLAAAAAVPRRRRFLGWWFGPVVLGPHGAAFIPPVLRDYHPVGQRCNPFRPEHLLRRGTGKDELRIMAGLLHAHQDAAVLDVDHHLHALVGCCAILGVSGLLRF